MAEKKIIKVQAELHWAKDLQAFNDYTEEKQQYVAHLYNISEDSVEKLKALGINPIDKSAKDIGFCLDAKSKKKFQPVDTEGKPIPVEKIGNGSKCTFVGFGYDWAWKNKKGVGFSVQKIIITDLIEYAAKVEDEEEELL